MNDTNTASETSPNPLQCQPDWPESCVARALKCGAVPASVATALTEELKGRARERPLKNSELAALAQKLIECLVETPAGEAAP